MSRSIDMQVLAQQPAAGAPFSFEEFERRQVARQRRRRATGWSAAASVAVAGCMAVLALVTQPQPAAQLGVPDGPAAVAAQSIPREPFPALVNLERFALTSEIEDYIAWLDAEISAARVYAAPPEQLREMESARAQLHESLVRVSYAQALLNR